MSSGCCFSFPQQKSNPKKAPVSRGPALPGAGQRERHPGPGRLAACRYLRQPYGCYRNVFMTTTTVIFLDRSVKVRFPRRASVQVIAAENKLAAVLECRAAVPRTSRCRPTIDVMGSRLSWRQKAETVVCRLDCEASTTPMLAQGTAIMAGGKRKGLAVTGAGRHGTVPESFPFQKRTRPAFAAKKNPGPKPRVFIYRFYFSNLRARS